MRLTFFCHSLLSDWNHGNAHFLRGLLTELAYRGHEVRAFESRSAWSIENLVAEHGEAPLADVRSAYPALDVTRYDPEALDVDAAVSGQDVVVVHEWSDPELVRRIGDAKARHGFALLFHDTHHRAVTDERAMSSYDLHAYDGALAFGSVIRDLYLSRRWARRAYTFHEAADVRIFGPRRGVRPEVDVVWVGNWGDDERAAEIDELLLRPVRRLGLSARAFGVRYPEHALTALAEAGIEHCGWLANHRVPEVFARARVTIHVPRRPYASRLPGIPTIRPFEALACEIPLISGPWSDCENLFRTGVDYLTASSTDEMCEQLERVLTRPELARGLARSGRERIESKHTCAHRAAELLSIVDRIARERGTAVGREAGAA